MTYTHLGATLLAVALTACSSDDAAKPALPDASTSDSSIAANDGGNSGADGGVKQDAAPQDPGALVMVVGGNDGKIRTFAVDDTSFALVDKGSYAAGNNAGFVAVDPIKLRVFSADASGSGTLRAFLLNKTTLALTATGGPVASQGANPAHISIDASGSHVLVANYGGGTVAAFPIGANGALSAASDVKSPGAKAHLAISNPSGGFVFVPCLDPNIVAQYTFSSGKLTALSPASVATPSGSGPRHLAFRPDEKFAYSINELASTVSAFAFDKSTGKLTIIATVSSLPNGFAGSNTGAEIMVHPSGKWVYASNRGHDSIAIFASDPSSGTLTPLGHALTDGMVPRSFGVDPNGRWLAVGNEKTNTLKAYRIDEAAGTLTPNSGTIASPSPGFVGLFRIRSL
jgi:6-phosphogluconolactonase